VIAAPKRTLVPVPPLWETIRWCQAYWSCYADRDNTMRLKIMNLEQQIPHINIICYMDPSVRVDTVSHLSESRNAYR